MEISPAKSALVDGASNAYPWLLRFQLLATAGECFLESSYSSQLVLHSGKASKAFVIGMQMNRMIVTESRSFTVKIEHNRISLLLEKCRMGTTKAWKPNIVRLKIH
ncbi:hypothetical protein RRG08_028082 [Elysia crispata]|uniref:Uncharacterized protein n=1 Tax=Elysia crispata TaxID=231223 RepID=A0AAE1DYU5_9GAST|nr:hypothetical protein RRG08_028082 [Elysia crispata]